MGRAAKAVLAILVLAGAAAGISYATNAITRTATSTLQACANGTNGNLRLVSSPSDCRTNETAVSWDVVGPTGAQGPQGLQGPAGQNGTNGNDGANGVSPVVAQLAADDPNCSTGGGVSITDGLGHIGYVCNGAKGDTGATGPAGEFSGAFQSPSGDFKLSVLNSGIKLQGPTSKITIDAGSLAVESLGVLTVKAGSSLLLDGGVGTSVRGGIVNIGSSGCAPPVRTTDIAGAFVEDSSLGTSPVTFPGLVPITDVCVG